MALSNISKEKDGLLYCTYSWSMIERNEEKLRRRRGMGRDRGRGIERGEGEELGEGRRGRGGEGKRKKSFYYCFEDNYC